MFKHNYITLINIFIFNKIMKSKTVLKKPPLPFNGNKKNWFKYFQQAFKDDLFNIKDNTIIIDLFGGSGILSHWFAHQYPHNKIIYNDYDNYMSIYTSDNINKLNELLNKIRNIIISKGIKKAEKIDDTTEIFELIKQYYQNYEENYKISNLLTANLCYNNGKLHIKTQLFNKVIKENYEYNENYIINQKNIQIIHEDYKNVIEQFKDNNNIFYILDPPYLATEKCYYNDFWGIDNNIDVIRLLMFNKCIIFESDKSQILSLLKLLKEYVDFDYITTDLKNFINRNSKNKEYAIISNINKNNN